MLQEKGLVSITTRSGWEGKHIYQILIERLSYLERVLAGYGFAFPVPRIRFHIEILRHLQRRPGIGSDEILWSLGEATELADIYCCLPTLPLKVMREKFGAVLNGPLDPQSETSASNLARNTVFELHLAGYLNKNGIPAELCHNPDIACVVGSRTLFVQCKRPFSRRKINYNMKLACKQLSRDLDLASGPQARGVVAISLSRAVNPGNMFMEVNTEADLTAAMAAEIKPLAEASVEALIRGPRIVGAVFHVSTAAYVKDINEYRTSQLLAVYPGDAASVSDRSMLRSAFLRVRS